MAIAIAQMLAKDGGTAQVSVTSNSFTPASGTVICAGASCYAASGDDTSTITISDSLGLTWTKRRERSQNDDGAGINAPPVVFWTATGTGSAMTVTTTRSVGSTGFAHVLDIWVLTGADTTSPVDASAEASITGTQATLTVVTTVDNCLLLFRSADWGSLVTPTADGNTTLDHAIANADIQGSFAGHRAVTTAGSYVIGTATPNSGTTINCVALAIKPGAGTVTGSASVSVGGLSVAATGVRTVLGTASKTLGGLTATATGVRTVYGSAAVSLGGVSVAATGARKVYGTSNITLGGLSVAAHVGSATAVDQGGGWWDLISILEENKAMVAEDRARGPLSCPHDGEPWSSGPNGELFCKFDGYQPSRGW